MPEEKEVFRGKTEDGVKVKIYKDKFHFRAFIAPGKQVGEAFCSLVDLLNSAKITLEEPKGEGNGEIASRDARNDRVGGSRPGQEGPDLEK